MLIRLVEIRTSTNYVLSVAHNTHSVSSMDKDRKSRGASSYSSIEESEDSYSETAGSTTEAEEEEINYWENLTPGILAFPGPLRLQSLLFIIGHLDEYGNESLALLPPHTRQTLLLNLPVIDVCRLEGSGVTEGIDMEEIWKTLYYNRLPTRQKKFSERYLTTVSDMPELTWKDCYFSSLFYLKFRYRPDDNDCDCMFGEHLHQDLLYGIYIRNGILEVQECFGPRSGSCFGVATYARHCCRLAPMRYIHQFPDQLNTARRRHDHTPPTTIYATIPTLVEVCKFEAKEFSADDVRLNRYFGAECFTDDYFPYLKLFFGSVRYLVINHDALVLHRGWKRIMDATVHSTHCKLKELCVCQSKWAEQSMAFLAPYFSPTHGGDTLTVPYAHLRQLHIEGAIQSTTDVLNTALILNHQNDLEVVTIKGCNCFSSLTPDPESVILAFANLFRKSSFQALALMDTTVPSSLVMTLVNQLFTSQSTNHQQLCFDDVRVLPDKMPLAISIPPQAIGRKSMEILHCVIEQAGIIFPPSMSFKNLTLAIGTEQRGAANVLEIFTHVHSLQVETMSLSIYASNKNSKGIVNLLNLVDTRNWSFHFRFFISSPHCDWNPTPEDISTVVDALTDIAPALGQLVGKGVVTLLSFAGTAYFDELPEPVLEALFEEIFQGLQRSKSRVELDLSDCRLKTSTLDCLYRVWKRSTDVKLKKLDLSGNELPQDNSNLQQVTEKLIHTSDYMST